MTGKKTPLVGPRRFQWNLGGWFGSSLGCSAWMMATAGFLAFNGQLLLAAVPTFCFVVTNIVAVAIWKVCDRIYPFSGMMSLLGVAALTVPITWIVVQTNALPGTLTKMNWPTSVLVTYAVLIAAPALMALFAYLEYFGDHTSATDSSQSKNV